MNRITFKIFGAFFYKVKELFYVYLIKPIRKFNEFLRHNLQREMIVSFLSNDRLGVSSF